MANTSVVEELRDLQVENFEHKFFVPYHALCCLFTRPKLQKLLDKAEIEVHLKQETIDAVLNNGIRLFAILASIGRISAITQFLRNDYFRGGQFDAKLPLGDHDLGRLFETEGDRKRFSQEQWIYLTPSFQDDQSCREIDDRTIMPFLHRKRMGGATLGAFGDIYLVDVYTQVGATPTISELVLKQITRRRRSSSIAVDFEHEVKIMSMVRCLGHHHIARLVTAFVKHDTYNMLLTKASGDLNAFFNSPRGAPGLSDPDSIIRACWGISSAIQAVHDYYSEALGVSRIGSHYDIRPGNILYMDGRFLLSDFGLSRLHEESDGSQSTFQHVDGSYVAPECVSYDDWSPKRVGRAADIWSWACVLCEILAYIAAPPGMGPENVVQFRESRRIKIPQYRTTWNRFYDAEKVNLNVIQFLNDHAANSERNAIPIRSVAALLLEALQMDPASRPSASAMTTRLFKISAKSQLMQIQDQVDPNIQHFEYQVELQRLYAWAKSVSLELDDDPKSSGESGSLAHSSKWEALKKIEDIMTKIHEEMKFIKQSSQPWGSHNMCYALRRLVDQLWGTADSNTVLRMFQQLEESALSIPEAEEDETNQHQMPPTITDQSTWKRRIHLIATSRSMSQRLESSTRFGDTPLLKRSSFVLPFKPFKLHSLTQHKDTNIPVLIETTRYDTEWKDRTYELIDRVQSIASLRAKLAPSQTLPMLQSLGYFHDSSHHEFGIAYKYPHHAQETRLQPFHLHTVLTTTSKRHLQPSLNQKLALALHLVTSFLNLHRAGWLHKNICSFNIIFFCQDETPKSLRLGLDSPYFIGFNHGRLNTDTAFSVGPQEKEIHTYGHPRYLEILRTGTSTIPVRFRQAFDYYSIGLVLLEIALWKPLSEITSAIQGDADFVLKELLRKHVGMVKIYMGEKYEEVVRNCLLADEATRDLDDAETRAWFAEKVMSPLNGCRV